MSPLRFGGNQEREMAMNKEMNVEIEMQRRGIGAANADIAEDMLTLFLYAMAWGLVVAIVAGSLAVALTVLAE